MASRAWFGLIAALLFFAWLAEEVRHGGTQQFDDRIRMLVHAHASPALTAVMRGISLIGEPGVLIVLGALFLFLMRAERPRRTLLFAVTVAGAEVLDQLLKLAFHRPRPAAFFGVAEPMGYSFPSGHALVSCAFFGALAVFAAARTGHRAWRWWYYTAAAAPIAAIGLSRVYLGMHYASDVLGGWAAAAAWLFSVKLARR
jgi:membrane-associated phospholipid phosphatase